jgi:hypothetical protein
MCRSLRPILDFLAEPLSRHNSIQQLTEKNNNSAVIITICLLPDNQSLTTLIAIMFAAFPPPNTNSSRDSTPQMPLRSCRDSTPQMPRRSSMPDYGCEDMDAIRKLNSTPQMPLRSCRDSTPQMPRRSSMPDYGCEDMDAIRKLNSTPQMPLRSCRDSTPQMPRRSNLPDYGCEDVDAIRKLNEYMHCISSEHATLRRQGSAFGRLYQITGPTSSKRDIPDTMTSLPPRLQEDSKWSSSTQAMNDTVPFQPPSHHRMSVGPSCAALKDRQKEPADPRFDFLNFITRTIMFRQTHRLKARLRGIRGFISKLAILENIISSLHI